MGIEVNVYIWGKVKIKVESCEPSLDEKRVEQEPRQTVDSFSIAGISTYSTIPRGFTRAYILYRHYDSDVSACNS